MTNEDWKKIEKELSIVGLGHVQLKIDGYKVDLFLTQISMFKNGIVFYVNDVFKGNWLTEDCEERRRFCCCKKKTIVTQNEIKKAGLRSKKKIQELRDKYSYNQYKNVWTNFKAMRNHFETNNKSIEIMEG